MRIILSILFFSLLMSCNKDVTKIDLEKQVKSDMEEMDGIVETRSVAEDCCASIQQELLLAEINCVTNNSGCELIPILTSQLNTCIATKTIDCPPGFIYDGENCYSRKHIPEGYEFFLFKGSLYVRPSPDCNESTGVGCCPPGFTFDGENCYSGTYVPEEYEWFIYNGAFYIEPTSADCRDRIPGCCPEGFEYDGANCTNGKTVPTGYSAFVFNNKFYVSPDPNCNPTPTNTCCPDGYQFDGANCYSGISFPEGHNGFIFNNRYYITPGDDCP